MKTILKKCKFCKKEFEASLAEHRRGNANFCSQSCGTRNFHSKKTKPKHNCKCAYCGKTFYRSAYKQTMSRSGLQFCTRSCKDSAQRIGGITQIQPPHYGTAGGRHMYRVLAFRKLPHKCNRCGYRRKVEILVVHHKDGNRTNNNLSNLEILCPNCHAIEHYA